MKKITILIISLVIVLSGCSSKATCNEEYEKGYADGLAQKNSISDESQSKPHSLPDTATSEIDEVSKPLATDIESKIDIEAIPTLSGEVCLFITNNSDVVIDSLNAQVNYLDESGMIVDTNSDGHDMILPGYTVVSRIDAPDEYFEIKTDFTMEIGTNNSYKNHSESVEILSNKGEDCIIVQATNNSTVMIDELEYVVVIYKNDEIVKVTYPHDVMDVGIDKTIVEKESLYKLDYDRFEVYLNQAHTFR